VSYEGRSINTLHFFQLGNPFEFAYNLISQNKEITVLRG
jgi:hypothetical protein